MPFGIGSIELVFIVVTFTTAIYCLLHLCSPSTIEMGGSCAGVCVRSVNLDPTWSFKRGPLKRVVFHTFSSGLRFERVRSMRIGICLKGL